MVDLEPERPIFCQIDQIIVNCLDEFRLTVGSEAHDLIFTRIDPESGVVSKCGIQQPERMREMNFPSGDNLLPSPNHADVVAHSPTPSIQSTTADLNGEG